MGRLVELPADHSLREMVNSWQQEYALEVRRNYQVISPKCNLFSKIMLQVAVEALLSYAE